MGDAACEVRDIREIDIAGADDGDSLAAAVVAVRPTRRQVVDSGEIVGRHVFFHSAVAVGEGEVEVGLGGRRRFGRGGGGLRAECSGSEIRAGRILPP